MGSGSGRAPDADRGAVDPELPGTGDPIADLILEGRAATVDQAEELYLDEHIDEVLEVLRSPLSDAEVRRHWLVALLLARGSRPGRLPFVTSEARLAALYGALRTLGIRCLVMEADRADKERAARGSG